MRFRPLLLLLAALSALVLAACGGDGESASDVDVNELLEQTFSGDKKVESGNLNLALKLDVQGASGGGLSGPVDVKLTGPFQSQGKGKLPRFDLDLSFTGAGQSIKAGAATTGDKGFVNFNGQEYAVSDEVFKQFKDGYEKAAAQGGDQENGPSLSTLGIDPRKWLESPTVSGEEKVGDTDTYRITGKVNVDRLLDDVNTALQKASQLGVQNTGQLPQQLTDEQKQQVRDAVRNLEVAIFTGKDDKTLRRMTVNLDLTVPEAQRQSAGAEGAKVAFDVQVAELNEDQEITEPQNTKPFDELLAQFGGLGGLGGLGGSSGGGSGGSGSGSSGSGGAAADEYSRCIEQAGGDLEKVQQCAEKLTP